MVFIKYNRIFAGLLLFVMMLGTYRGRLALWNEGGSEPVVIYPQLISMLPEADQQRLQSGIPIENESRLHRLLEDYLS